MLDNLAILTIIVNLSLIWLWLNFNVLILGSVWACICYKHVYYNCVVFILCWHSQRRGGLNRKKKLILIRQRYWCLHSLSGPPQSRTVDSCRLETRPHSGRGSQDPSGTGTRARAHSESVSGTQCCCCSLCSSALGTRLC